MIKVCKEVIYLYNNALYFKYSMTQTGNLIIIRYVNISGRKYHLLKYYFLINKENGMIWYYTSYDKNVPRM